jgi:hypothetical protein
MAGPRETDEELGMTENIAGGWGWGGIAVTRVSWGDFRVSERMLEGGEVCVLDDIESVPPAHGIEGRAEYCRFSLLKVLPPPSKPQIPETQQALKKTLNHQTPESPNPPNRRSGARPMT